MIRKLPNLATAHAALIEATEALEEASGVWLDKKATVERAQNDEREAMGEVNAARRAFDDAQEDLNAVVAREVAS